MRRGGPTALDLKLRRDPAVASITFVRLSTIALFLAVSFGRNKAVTIHFPHHPNHPFGQHVGRRAFADSVFAADALQTRVGSRKRWNRRVTYGHRNDRVGVSTNPNAKPVGSDSEDRDMRR